MIPRKHPDPAAVRALRERRGWTHEQMADATGALPLEVAAWEAGTMRVPPAQARRLRELAATDRHRAAGRAPGPRWMAPCAWATEHAPDLHQILWYEPREVETNPAVRTHLEECSTCRQVLELGRAQRALGPAPAEASPGHLGYGLDSAPRELLLLLAAAAGTVPIVLVAWLLGSLKDRYPDLPGPGDLWVEALVGLVALSLTHRVTAGPLRKHPYAGGLLAGFVGVLAGMVTWKLRNPLADLSSGVVLAVCLVLAVVAGLLDGLERSAAADDAPDDEEAHAGREDAAAPAGITAGVPLDDLPAAGAPARPEPVPSAARRS